ncbi:MAG: choice-of-anchor tandem repeat GloVer-containing protein [Terriglobales bacterium]
MTYKRLSPAVERVVILIALAFAALASSQLHAQTFKVLYGFTGETDGANPLAGFVADNAGNLYGTANAGGAYGAGIVFKITRKGQMIVLYNFTGGTDGANPEASLLRDHTGSFYGTTNAGGAFGNGVVFKMTPKGKETVLYSFKGGADGANPEARLAEDEAGNFYGTTFSGGASNSGTVFEVTRKGQETLLHSFSGSDGANPVAGVTFDKSGNLYGTTSVGGLYGNGNVFELAKSGWTETSLHDFQLGSDGGVPYGGLVFDASGNIFGSTTDGGSSGSDGGGTIFELTPNGTSWTFNTIYALAGWGISGTFRDLLLDASGNIYATTHCDGAYNAGTVYKLTNSEGIWSYTELYTFTGGSDGLYSFSNLVADKQGHLYGTTNQGGSGYGVVFEVTP